MQVKELELTGFKSFVDKVKLNFKPGITAIVGPNGCGKSNIIDAIRWIMGEHNARELRGKKMEDLIFNGSETRKATGMAEVSMVLSNGSNGNGNGNGNGKSSSALGNASEIMITRRLFRSGDSEYFINKVPCRLRDIVELFLDTGVGSQSYSIMEQGKVDYILSLKPDERRILIEEAAGIAKYRSRKKEALSRMESTRSNVARLKDILAELQTQMRNLELQVKRLKRHRALKEEIRGLDLQLAADRHAALTTDIGRMQQELTSLQDLDVQLDARLSTGEAELAACRLQQTQLQQTISDLQQACYNRREMLQREENNLSLCRHDLQTAETQIERIARDLSVLDDEIARCRTELAVHQEQADAAARMIRDIEHNASVSSASVAAAKGALAVHRSRIEQINQELRAAAFRTTEIKNALLLNTRLIDEMNLKAEKLSAEEAACRTRHADLTREHALRESQLHETMLRREQHEKELEAIAARRDSAAAHLAERESSLAAIKEQHAHLRARYTSLKELHDSYEGFTDGVKQLMNAAAEKADLRQNIVCLFTDILETDAEHERAIEAVLDKRLQTVVVPSWEACMTLTTTMRDLQAGKISCIPCFATLSHDSAEAPEGTVPLATLVRTPDQYRALILQVFDRTYLVQSLDQAVALRRSGHTDALFVTSDGDMLDAAGIVTGGGISSAVGSLLARAREVRLLASRIEQVERDLADAECARNEAARTVEQITEACARFAAEKQHLDIRLIQDNAAIEQLARDILQEQKRIAVIESEQQDLERSLTRMRAEREELTLQEQRAAEQEAAAAGARDDAMRQDMHLVAELERIESAATEMRITLASARAEYDTASASLRRLQSQYDSAIAKQNDLLNEREQLFEKIRELEASCKLSEEALRDLAASAHDGEKDLDAVRSQLDVCSSKILDHEASLKRLRADKQELEPRMYDIRRELSNTAIHVDHLAASLRDKYGLSLEALPRIEDPASFDEPSIRQRLEQLQKRLDNIGDVNPGAAREYEELEQRYAYLCSQEQDLLQSLESLHKVISKINRVTRQKFMESFTEINKNFQELFPLLFNGGKAYLQLTNENDLLETGIDIFAQPPGKKLQSLELLSGGERALTVIAILFSIFLTKPTPFCLMDEIDAPLDDTNIGRFIDHMQKMAKNSQFIIVTHNKLSMQAADSLYGVTMEERGVSKVVSVALN